MRMCFVTGLGSGLDVEMWTLQLNYDDLGTPRPDLPGEARQVSDSEVQYTFGELTLIFHNFPAVDATAKLYEAAVAAYQSR